MTKKDLLLALQRFPDETPMLLQVGQHKGDLLRVEMAIDASPQTIEPKNDAESWQQLLVNKLKLTLVAGTPDSLK